MVTFMTLISLCALTWTAAAITAPKHALRFLPPEKRTRKHAVLLGCTFTFVLFTITGSLADAAAPSESAMTAATLAPTESANAGALEEPEPTAAELAASFIERVEGEITELQSFDVSKYTGTTDQIVLAASVLFPAYAMIIEEAGNHELTQPQADRVRAFRNQLQQVQRAAFPKLRDAYGPAVRRTLWENDIEARTFGSGFRTIEFVGGIFAANRNKQAFQTEVHQTLRYLRFTQSRYKWYSQADKYTYYTISPPADAAVVLWRNGVPIPVDS